VVTDTDGRIISSLNLISQTWAYDGIPFAVGRPELVATLPEYRRRGLVRQQMALIHQKSAARGELVQAITGIPWYYRQFGYEMGLDLGGGRQLFWARPGNDEKVETGALSLAPGNGRRHSRCCKNSTLAHLGRSLITRLRSSRVVALRDVRLASRNRIWTLKPQDDPDRRTTTVVGYVNYEPFGTAIAIAEFGVRPGHSWRSVGRFLVRYLREEAGRAQSRPAPLISS
jgi:hypothetical protein